MVQRTVEMEPGAALAGMLAALGEAGRYAGRGVRVGGRRVGRRARVVGAEAALRAVLAARVLAGRQPRVQRSRRGLFVVALGATTAGAAVAVAARQAVEILRNRDTRATEPVSE